MKINEIRYDVLQSALRVFTWEKNFEIYTMSTDVFTRHDPDVYGVNWSATGTQNAETTRAFAESLIKATEIVDKLNGLQLKRVWDKMDEYITTKEVYDYDIQMLAKALEAGDYKVIEDYLMRGAVED